MGPTARPERRRRCPPDTPSDSQVSRAPVVDSNESRSHDHIDQPPKTYRPIGRKADRGRHTHSHSREHEKHSSRAKSRLKDQQLYRRGGTLWDKSIGPAVFYEHREPQSGRLPGNEDRISVTIGIDTQRYTRRASLTLPKPLGEPCFSSSRKPRVVQDRSHLESSGRHSRPYVPRTDEKHRNVRTEQLLGAGRDPREKGSEGAKKSSKRDQENSARPELTEENVILNARRESPSYRPDVGDGPTRPPLTGQATTRPERGLRSSQKTRESPANPAPIPKVHDSRGDRERSTRGGDTYPSRNDDEGVRRGRRMERKERRKVPATAGDNQKDTATYRSRSPQLASYSVDRRSKPIRTRRSSIGHPPILKEVRPESSPPNSDMSGHTDYSEYETRRTVKRKSTQQTTCSCTVS
jgi:hypothetical protein